MDESSKWELLEKGEGLTSSSHLSCQRFSCFDFSLLIWQASHGLLSQSFLYGLTRPFTKKQQSEAHLPVELFIAHVDGPPTSLNDFRSALLKGNKE